MTGQVLHRPYKNTAVALLFSVILGPLGLLYASLRGGIAMILLGIVVISNGFIFPIILLWLACSIWAVASVEAFNRRLEAARNKQ